MLNQRRIRVTFKESSEFCSHLDGHQRLIRSFFSIFRHSRKTYSYGGSRACKVSQTFTLLIFVGLELCALIPH
ncbi:hypothetical protein Hypma_005961 [Hypsizygus marmoreus]|uniref:Uncharacterized protein n=1 Tax=Hypsizygus marmoreus TaxID=39966 RepID=A0A369KCV0_HYPMA|nr:hypothetical protein Hypma_005961 [Hypsizygus marmoreus]